jgi:hypothetical protein
MTGAFAVLKRHYRAIMAAGGAVLIVMRRNGIARPAE